MRMLSWLGLQLPFLLLPLSVVSFLQPGPLHPGTLTLPLPPPLHPMPLPLPLMPLLSPQPLCHLLVGHLSKRQSKPHGLGHCSSPQAPKLHPLLPLGFRKLLHLFCGLRPGMPRQGSSARKRGMGISRWPPNCLGLFRCVTCNVCVMCL